MNYFFCQYLVVKAIIVAITLRTIGNISIIRREFYYINIINCRPPINLGSLVFVIGGLVCNQLVNFFTSNKIIVTVISCIILAV